MQREISYEYSPPLVKLATGRFIWRHAGRGLIACCVIAVAGIIALISHQSPDFPWLPIVAIGFSIGVGITWFRYYLRAPKVCETMPDRRVTVRVEPDTITLQTSEHTSTLKWSRIKTVWRFPKVLLLFTYDKQSAYSMLPVESLGDELQQYIEERIREHGGKIA